MKYGDIPVSEYTGVPNISIPIYTIEQGLVSLPIELKYHGSGIKVNQEATWVGLGWDLMIGGSITRVIVEGNDDLCIYDQEEADWVTMINAHSGLMLPQLFATTGYSYWGCWKAVTEDPGISENVLHHLVDGGNRDYYAVNFPRHSFKFMFDPKDEDTPVFIGQKSKCKIQRYNDGFLITDEKGIKYYFTARETVLDSHSNGYCQNWFLYLITTPTGQNISFTYASGAIYPLATLTEKRTVWDNVNLNYVPQSEIGNYRNIINSVTSINKLYPTTIVTDKEIIEFAIGERNDYNGTGAAKLTGITVKDIDGNTKFKYKFNYNYFSSSNVGGDYFQDDDVFSQAVSESLKGSRLKLEDIERIVPGTSPEAAEYSYQFQYNEAINLPLKSSFAVDYWGYYNGQQNTSTLMNEYNAHHTLVPDAGLLKYVAGTLPNELFEGGGANRGASKTQGTTGMLKSITYPTGGKTVFEFEPNQFTNYNYYSAEDNNEYSYTNSCSVWDYNNNASNQHIEIEITEPVTAHLEAVIQSWDFDDVINATITFVGPLGPSPVGYYYGLDPSMEDEYNQNGNRMFWSEDIDLVPGTYIFHCDLPDALGNTNYYPVVAGSITYSDFTPPESATPIGGGLRVKSITNYDTDGTFAGKKSYTYIGGKLLSPPKLFEKRTVSLVTSSPEGTSCPKSSVNVYKLSPSSFFETVNSSGAIVGYDEVEITETNATGIENGKKILTFTNNEGVTYYDRIKYFNFCTNGNLQEEVILDNARDTVRVTMNTWELEDRQQELLNGFAVDNYFGPNDFCGVSSGIGGVAYNSCIYDNRFLVFIYPLNSFQNSLVSRKVTDYSSSGKITTITNFVYSMNNYEISSLSEINSYGTETKYIRYPADINSSYYSSMVSNNMINYPVETVLKFNNEFIGSSLTTYKPSSGSYVPDKKYKLEITSDLSSFSYFNGSTKDSHYGATPELTFNTYRNNGKVLQVTGKDGIVTSFLWDETGSYVMAKVENATYSEISSLDGKVCTYSSSTLYTSIKNLVSDAIITTYSYKALWGLTEQTDPTGVTTTYNYDDLGRLEYIKNDDLKLLKKYIYHYAE